MGRAVGSAGDETGAEVGSLDGAVLKPEVGCCVSCCWVGAAVDVLVGACDGEIEGVWLGCLLGGAVDVVVGCCDGEVEGVWLGCCVGCWLGPACVCLCVREDGHM